MGTGFDRIEQEAGAAAAAWDAYDTARDACLGDMWAGVDGAKLTNKEKTEALFIVLNLVRAAFGRDPVAIPAKLPAILPAPPPPPPPPEPPPPPVDEQPPPAADAQGGKKPPAAADKDEVIGPSPGGGADGGGPPPQDKCVPPPECGEEVIGPWTP